MTTEPMGMLVDVVRCGGCHQCVEACMQIHGFEGDPEAVTELSATACTALAPFEEDYSVRNLCRHCIRPACASVCPVGALRKTPEGPVVYSPEACIGCRYCMVACPFNVPRYEWNERVPQIQKCDMCFERIQRGEIPACAAACRQEATVFGPRSELIAEAHQRIADEPEEYFDHVYGEFEVGGTSVLFLAPCPLEQLGYKEILGNEPLPDRTEVVPKRIPAVVMCGGAALMAVWWITRRRNELGMARAAAARTAHEQQLGDRGAHDEEASDVEA